MFPDFEFRMSLYISVPLLFLLDFMPNYKVSIAIYNKCDIQTREVHSSGHLYQSLLECAYVHLVWTNPFSILAVVFRTMHFKNFSVLTRF